MGSLKEIRNRIQSVTSTMQITSAMKMVSASKLKRAQDAIVQMRPYAEKLQDLLVNVSATLDSTDGVYSQEREAKNILVIAISSNKGLCGTFNNNIIKGVKPLLSEFKDDNIKILPLGKKMFDAYNKLDLNYTEGFSDEPYTIFNDLTFANTSAIAQEVMDQFEAKKWDKVVIVYNKFKNAAVQATTVEPFLPIVKPENVDANSSVEYIYEPNKESILDEIIPKSLKTQLFKALLDSHASEHGARMTAMHQATDNADSLRNDLKLTYNKARQASITGEILEIVGGAEAM